MNIWGFNMIDIDEKIYEDFENKFGGCFCQVQDLVTYKDKNENQYILNDGSKKLVELSLKDNVNYLLSNKIFTPEHDLFY